MQNKSKLQSTHFNPSRRKVFLGLTAALGSIIVGQNLSAQVIPPNEQPVCPPPVKPVQSIPSEIARNHGHDFLIEFNQVLGLIGQPLDIQGDSGHPHTIMIENQHVISLLKGEAVLLISSRDANHTHEVTLKLVEVSV